MAWRVVPPASHGIPRVPQYSGYSLLLSVVAYVILTLFDLSSHTIRLTYRHFTLSTTPTIFLQSVWPLPVSLAATSGISFDFSSSAYLDVSVQRVFLPYTILFIYGCQSIALTGSPIRTSADLWIFAPPRSFSQLVTSFFGSRCQGIHLVLFIA